MNKIEIGLRAVLLLASMIVAFLGAELAVRAFPGLLPESYRQTFPARGVEFFNPGLLTATPVEGVPIGQPRPRQRMRTPLVPADLQHQGLVDPDDNPDTGEYSFVEIEIDELGFANLEDRPQADIVFVGDSFTFATGTVSPVGLQMQLEQLSGLSIYNLGVSGIGPHQEDWLLMNLGLQRQPRLVIWFFFGGNDVHNAEFIEDKLLSGVTTYADLHPDFAWPRSFLFDLVAWRFRATGPNPENQLPGFVLNVRNKPRLLWFAPQYLREASRTLEELNESQGWQAIRRILPRVARTLNEHGSQFLVVYVPSKAQVYLPHVLPNPTLAYQAVAGRTDAPQRAESFWERMMANRGNVEQLLRELCEGHEISYLSLTDPLSALAERQQLGYFSADTHWNEVGQSAALPPLMSWLQEAGLVSTTDAQSLTRPMQVVRPRR